MGTDNNGEDRETKSFLDLLWLRCFKGRPKIVIGVLADIALGIFIIINNEGVEGFLAGIIWIVGTVLLILFIAWLVPSAGKE